MKAAASLAANTPETVETAAGDAQRAWARRDLTGRDLAGRDLAGRWLLPLAAGLLLLGGINLGLYKHLTGAAVAPDIPLLSANDHSGLTTTQSDAVFAADETLDRVSKAAAVVPAPLGERTGNGLAFHTINGAWVQDGAVIRQEKRAATDFSLATDVAATTYTFEVAVTLPSDPALTDAGGGILFHMPTHNRKEGAHMVRFVNGGAGLSWGYFSADGSFTGQGYVELDLPPGQPQRLALTVRGSVFDVLINGAAVVQEVPTTAQSGWIGLLSFRGPVAFGDVRLTFGDGVP